MTFNWENEMSGDTTIILELTPREAAAIHEMALMYSWDRGDYKKEIKDIYLALDEVRLKCFYGHRTVTKTSTGTPDTGLWWMEEDEDWTIGRPVGE